MEALKLVKTNEQQQEPTRTVSQIRQELIKHFFDSYKKHIGEKCNENWLKCRAVLINNFEGIDEDTGELYITYPHITDWENELLKFFYNSKENWFRLNRKCTFYLFCKHYGRYDHHIPKQQPKLTQHINTEKRLYYTCSQCKVENSLFKSRVPAGVESFPCNCGNVLFVKDFE